MLVSSAQSAALPTASHVILWLSKASMTIDCIVTESAERLRLSARGFGGDGKQSLYAHPCGGTPEPAESQEVSVVRNSGQMLVVNLPGP